MFPIMFKSNLDWDLLGERSPGLDNRRLYLPRGRMIGGCSSINAMIYLRGHRLDFDEWAANGADGWSYDEMLPYFKRGRTTSAARTRSTASTARWPSRDSRSMHPLVDTMLEAAVQAGHEHIDDLNVDRPEGVGRFQLTQRGGMRCSTADAFLHPAQTGRTSSCGLGLRAADRLRRQSRSRCRDHARRQARDASTPSAR